VGKKIIKSNPQFPLLPDSLKGLHAIGKAKNGCKTFKILKFLIEKGERWKTRPQTRQAKSQKIEFPRVTNNSLDIDHLKSKTESKIQELIRRTSGVQRHHNLQDC
jgi:hypothetical protein